MGLFGTNLEGSVIDTSVEMVMRDSSVPTQKNNNFTLIVCV